MTKSPRIYTEWLPDHVAKEAEVDEPGRFATVVKNLRDDWNRDKDKPWPQCFARTHQWFPIIYQYMGLRRYFPYEDVELLVNTSLEIVMASRDEVSVLVRYCEVLTHFLKKYRKELRGKVEISWREMYDLAKHMWNDKRFAYQGDDTLVILQDVITDLVFKSAPLFPNGSAVEIWDEFRPQILHTQGHECFEALGWLVTFMPASSLEFESDVKGDWNGWVVEWMAILQSKTNCDFWDRGWLDLFARVAKHDTKGRIAWVDHMDELFSCFLRYFHVPVGTATGEMRRWNSYSSTRASALFPVNRHNTMKSVGQCIIYMLRNDVGGESGIAHLEKLIALLEQYYHPSNGGDWTQGLSQFLKSLVRHFMEQIAKQNRDKETDPGLIISPETEERCISALLKVASRGQYSKDDNMRLRACQAMCDMSYVSPKTVLPLVYNRFQHALESMTATLTLPASIHALSICVRPLLLTGLAIEGEFDEKEAAAQAVAGAMMDVLPGIDANDPTKTGAVFRYYCSVLFSIPSLDATLTQEKGWYSLPVDVEMWAEELLSRMFVLLENLDSPAQRSDQSQKAEKASNNGTFLMLEYVFFEPFVGLFLLKLPESLRVRAIKRIGEFALTSCLPGVVHEVGQLCSSAADVDPDMAVQHIINPLIDKILEELPPVKDGKPNRVHFSHGLETTVMWNLDLLSSAMVCLGNFTVKNMERVMEVIDRSLAITSREIQTAGASILDVVISSLVGLYPDVSRSQINSSILPSGLHQWVSKEPDNYAKPSWRYPSKECLEAAEKFVEKYLVAGIAELNALAEESSKLSSNDFKDKILWVMAKMCGTFLGANEHLVDFNIPSSAHNAGENSSSAAVPIQMAGDSKILIGRPGLREDAARAVHKICPCLEDQDPTILTSLVQLIDSILCLGDVRPPDEYVEIEDPDESPQTVDMFFTEPAVAAKLFGMDGMKWQKRRPYSFMVVSVCDEYLNRSACNAYGKWLSSAMPLMLDINMVPKEFGELFGDVVGFSMHRYEDVRQTAEHVVDKGFVRFPCLSEIYTPIFLMAIARCPLPDDMSLWTLSSNPEFPKTVYDQLAALMEQMEADKLKTKDGDSELGLESKQDAAVDGAVNVMCTSNQAWREMFTRPEKMVTIVQAMMGSRRNSSVDAQSVTSVFIWQFLVRFVSPKYLNQGCVPPAITLLFEQLVSLGQEGTLMNWKYTLLANVLLLAMLPQRQDPVTLPLLSHFLAVMDSNLPPLRKVAMAGLYGLLRPFVISDIYNGEIASKVASFVSQPSFGQTLVHVLVHGHVNLYEEDDKRKMQRYLKHLFTDGSFEERLVRNAHMLVDRIGKWPEADNPTAILDGSFDLTHARVVEGFASMAPLKSLAAVRQPLSELLENIQSREGERGDQSALAELLSGLIASGAPWVTENGTNAWDSWLKDLTKEALSQAPLELRSTYAFCMRYAVRGLLDLAKRESANPGIPVGVDVLDCVVAVFEAMSGPMDMSRAGMSAGVIKQLSYQYSAVKELKTIYPLNEMPAKLLPVWSRMLSSFPEQMCSEFQSVREYVASLLVLVCGYLLTYKDRDLDAPQRQLVNQVQGICNLVVGRFEEGIHALKLKSKSGNSASNHTKGDADDAMDAVDAVPSRSGTENGSFVALDAKVGMAAQFVILAMRDSQSPQLQGTLIQLLSGLFQIQELGDPSLKPLQMEASTAFAVIKYLYVSAEHVGKVVDILAQSDQLDQWHARGAGLIFEQVFWFRHCFLLSDEQSDKLDAFVMGRLSDSKLEVQTVASSTLAGMLKGMGTSEEEKLRDHFMSKLVKFYPNGRRPSRKKQDPLQLKEKHACILGIRAFITCHPYDIPDWMPEMLTTVVRAAGEPPPIKTTITKMLGDFRRTHENESHQELRAAFNEDQWEALQGVGSQAAYFT